jgi:hypothetical protein
MPDQDTYQQQTQQAREEARQEQEPIQEEIAALLASVAAFWASGLTEDRFEDGLEEIRVQASVIVRRRRQNGTRLLREGHAQAAEAIGVNFQPGQVTLNPQKRRGVPDVPTLMDRVLQRHAPGLREKRSGKALATAIARSDDGLASRVASKGVDLTDDPASGLYEDLKRTAATELVDALDEAEKHLHALSPAVGLVEWQISGRHDSLPSSPDVCDLLASQDLYGHGDGLYPAPLIPPHPHPYCECSTRPVVTEAPDPSDPPSIDISTVRSELESLPGERTVTDAHAEAQTRQLRSALRRVHESPRG